MHRARYATFFILSLSILLFGCGRDDSSCLIKVGDFCESEDDFRQRLERFAEESMIDSMDMLEKMKPVLVDNIVEERLILEYADDNYITVSDKEVDIAMGGFLDGLSEEDINGVLMEEYRDREDIRSFIRNRALIDKTIERAVNDSIDVSEESIREYYDNNRNQFLRSASVELYHVFVKDKYKAREALVMLRSGVALSEVVRMYSESEDVADTGFMGVFVRGELPDDVEDVVFEIPERRYSGIIDTVRGYHIFYVEKKTKAGLLPVESVREEILAKLREDNFEKEYAKWIDTLQKEYKPEVNWDEIKSVTLN